MYKCVCGKKYQYILNICKYKYKYFLNMKNVQGIALGYKLTKGFYTNELCIAVFVNRKVKNIKLCLKDTVPLMYKGIKTDVVEIGKLTVYNLKNRIRPVLGGYSIGPAQTQVSLMDSAGSMGCLVEDSLNTYILSCSHVLSFYGNLPIGTYILQPSTIDGGDVTKDGVAGLYKSVPVQDLPNSNIVDCAIALPFNKESVSSAIAIVGIPKGINTVKLGEFTKKAARVTGYTTGHVKYISATLKIKSIDAKTLKEKLLLYKDQIVTSKMLEDGDSGSVLLNVKNEVVGLAQSGTDTISVFNPIEAVLNSLNVKIVTK